MWAYDFWMWKSESQLRKFKDTVKRSRLISSILTLQLCQSPEIFQRASRLFVQEMEMVDDEQVRDFKDYFVAEWLEQNSKMPLVSTVQGQGLRIFGSNQKCLRQVADSCSN